MTTFLAFVFVLGVLVFVHELGHFLPAARRRPGAEVLARLRPDDAELPARRHRIRHRRDPARRLRQDGRREPRGSAPARDEFLSKTKWERFQVLIMGPVMNLGSRSCCWRSCLCRAPKCRPTRISRRSSARSPDSPAAKADIRPATIIVSRRGPAGRHVGRVLPGGLGTRPNREVTLTFDRDGRDGPAGDAGVVARRTSSRSATSACWPDVHPNVPKVAPGEPADKAGIKPGDVILAINGEPIVLPSQLVGIIGRNTGNPITVTVRRDGRAPQLPSCPSRVHRRGGRPGVHRRRARRGTKKLSPVSFRRS